ncbi:MAG TPA: hypothetical protein VKT32_03320, partial [Chthonomonadaceae bacterium]|nr:hypothetical protein [Chthonomonadaceae bacterium]
MPTEVIVHAPGYRQSAPYEEIAHYLQPLPDAHIVGNEFVFGDEEAGIQMSAVPGHMQEGAPSARRPGPDSAGQCNYILLTVPEENLTATCGPLAEFSFNLARRLGWKVYNGPGEQPVKSEAELQQRLSGHPIAARGLGGCASLLALLLPAALL